MNIVGLITEYNPFHNGHLYHIRKAKEITSADYLVVIMSGNFVQRGTPAFMDKYTRTKMALSCGADLVLELPVHYATASAEYFAKGAITILHKLGIITHVCFGSECGDITVLNEIAHLLLHESQEYKQSLTTFIKQGYSYPKARMEALSTVYPHIPKDILVNPNNILGIEYMKALITLDSNISPVTITRIVSNYHDTSLKSLDNSDPCVDIAIPGSISSATAIRKTLNELDDLQHIIQHVPADVYSLMDANYKKVYPITEDDFTLPLIYKLMHEDTNTLTSYLDVTEELANRIINETLYGTNYSTLSLNIKSKQLTHTRINRSLLHILLHIKEEAFTAYTKDSYTCYARILGFKKTSSSIIRKIVDNESIPVITKVADARKILNPMEYAMFEEDIKATRLYNHVVYDKYKEIIEDDYTRDIIRM